MSARKERKPELQYSQLDWLKFLYDYLAKSGAERAAFIEDQLNRGLFPSESKQLLTPNDATAGEAFGRAQNAMLKVKELLALIITLKKRAALGISTVIVLQSDPETIRETSSQDLLQAALETLDQALGHCLNVQRNYNAFDRTGDAPSRLNFFRIWDDEAWRCIQQAYEVKDRSSVRSRDLSLVILEQLYEVLESPLSSELRQRWLTLFAIGPQHDEALYVCAIAIKNRDLNFLKSLIDERDRPRTLSILMDPIILEQALQQKDIRILSYIRNFIFHGLAFGSDQYLHVFAQFRSFLSKEKIASYGPALLWLFMDPMALEQPATPRGLSTADQQQWYSQGVWDHLKHEAQFTWAHALVLERNQGLADKIQESQKRALRQYVFSLSAVETRTAWNQLFEQSLGVATAILERQQGGNFESSYRKVQAAIQAFRDYQREDEARIDKLEKNLSKALKGFLKEITDKFQVGPKPSLWCCVRKNPEESFHHLLQLRETDALERLREQKRDLVELLAQTFPDLNARDPRSNAILDELTAQDFEMKKIICGRILTTADAVRADRLIQNLREAQHAYDVACAPKLLIAQVTTALKTLDDHYDAYAHRAEVERLLPGSHVQAGLAQGSEHAQRLASVLGAPNGGAAAKSSTGRRPTGGDREDTPLLLD